MEEDKKTETVIDKSFVTCPNCNKVLIQALVITDGIIKCDKCHRRYLINVGNGNLTIKRLSKPNDDNLGST